MKCDISRLINFYKNEVSSRIQEVAPFQATEQLKQMAAFFSPGLFYFYILNFQNLRMEYVDPNIKQVLGYEPGSFSLQQMLDALPPEEFNLMEKKEHLVADFLFRYLTPAAIPKYKVVYFLRIRDAAGQCHVILHQSTPLTVSLDGKINHMLGVHTDVSHLNINNHHTVSFISLTGGTSFFNINPDKERFHPKAAQTDPHNLAKSLTNQEVKVIHLLAKGLSAKTIAEELHVSFHTIRTHRKNILEKTGCANTTELVAKCLIEGVI